MINNLELFNTRRITYVLAIVLFSATAVFGLSLLTHNDQDSNVGTSSASTQQPADINNDNKVDVYDLSTLLSKWNTADTLSDLNKDGTVNVYDLSTLLSKWGVVVAAKPDQSNTGVLPGVTLRSITAAYPDATTKGYTVNAQGRVTITKDGGVYENLLLPHGVWIKASNVTIRNSRITASKSSFTNLPDEPTSWDNCRQIRTAIEAAGQSTPSVFVVDANAQNVTNFVLEDSEIAQSEYSIYLSSYMGHDTTMRRVDISGGVDGIGTYNGSATAANFTIEDSYIHDLYRGSWSVGNYNIAPGTTTKVYCGYDAAHPEATHNDGIQMHRGANVIVRRNTINPKPINHTQANAGIMGNGVGNLLIDGNHFQYGVCSVNLVSGLTLPVTVSNNTFYGNNGNSGTGAQGTGCAIIRPASAGYNFSNNNWQDGTVVVLTNGS